MNHHQRMQNSDFSQLARLPVATAAQLQAVHAICEDFESSWATGSCRAIEQIVTESPAPLRPYLVESLVRSEVELLMNSGVTIDPQEYVKRFGEDGPIVARAFVPVEELDCWDRDGIWPDSTDAPSLAGSRMGTVRRAHHKNAQPQRLGPFDIIEEIASGGMGVVYRGRHHELKRDVAVKCIRAGLLANDLEIQRFRKEAQTVAALGHDSIVPIYEVGSEQGLHYFAMPFIDGVDLGARVASGPIDMREIARIVRDVAVATQFAHVQGIVHRDLKPRNILLDQDDKVWVTDFG